MRPEVGQAPRDGHEQSARPDLVPLLDVLKSELELVASGEQRPAGGGSQPGGEELVVERRHDDLDAVVAADANTGVDVLLERSRLHNRGPCKRDAVEKGQERGAEDGPAHAAREDAPREPLLPIRHGAF